METSPIIAELDPPRNIFPGMLAGRVNGAVDQLDFQRTVDRFRQRIVIADSRAADGLAYPEPLQRVSELAGRVIAAAVAVEYRTVREVEVPGGHLDRGR